jgi:hypothetical protein
LTVPTAAKLLFDIHQRQGNLKYNAVGTVKSLFGPSGTAKSADTMDSLLQRVLEGKGHAFFCSQFVVYVYQWAAEQSRIPANTDFNISDAKVSPAVLASKLVGNPKFAEAGYMMPNER